MDFVSVAFGCGQSHRDTFRFLPYWLSHLRAFNAATDARDTVYGILGIMASQWPDWPPFPVDYTITPALVYERFVKYVVRHTGVLNVLERKVSDDEDDVLLDGLPSWVPDMRCLPVGATTKAINSKLVPLPAHSLASSTSTVDIPTLDQSRDGEIRLQGKVIDEVEVIFHGKLPVDFTEMRDWKTVLVEAGRQLSWWALEPIGGTNNSILSNLIEALELGGAYYMFATKHKRAGVTPYRIQTGDDVVLMAGLDVPAVLRPRGAGTYTFIGRAAVENLMHGQEWDNEQHSVGMDTLVLV